MGLADLQAAFGALNKGLGEFAIGQATREFQSNVAQASETIGDVEQRQAFVDEQTNNFALRLTRLGAPASTIKTVIAQFEPKFSRAQSSEAILLDPKSTTTQRETAQTILDERAKTKRIAAETKVGEREAKTRAREDIVTSKRFSDLTKKIDPALQVRSAVGKAAARVQAANDVEAVVGQVKDLNSLTPIEIKEMGIAFAAILSPNLVNPSDEQIASIVPQSINMKRAEWEQIVSGETRPANSAAFAKLFLKGARRQRNEAELEVSEAILSASRGFPDLARKDPTRFRNIISKQLQRFGTITEPEDIIIDDKRGVISTKRSERNRRVTKLMIKRWRRAVALSKSNDPDDQLLARKTFKKLGINEAVTARIAESQLRLSVTRGRIGEDE